MTLTYAGDGPESAVLRYKDIQELLYRLRAKRGGNYNVRYICAGEYGTKKGRAHWHIILFFYGRSPDVKIGARINWKYWPHGFSYFQNPDYQGFRYVMKYALKQEGNEGFSKALSMSKKPPLGHNFFKNMADDIVERRLPIHSPEYSFAHVLDSQGRPRKYWLQGRMREIFLDRYYIMWRMLYGNEPPWSDFLLEGYLDPIERKRMDDDPARFERNRAQREAEYKKRIELSRTDEFWKEQSGRVSLGYLVFSGTTDMVHAYSDNSAVIYQGDKQWQVTEGNVPVSAQLLRGGMPISKIQPVLTWCEAQWRNHRDRLQKLSPS
ncbi:replication initiation protein [Tortoise microvirus 70]|nr:replication initiation protein [Tortoise microvirus 70]